MFAEKLFKNRLRPTYANGFLTGVIVSCSIAFLCFGIFFNKETWDDWITRRKARYIFKYGLPIHSPPIIAYQNHIVAYDASRKIPFWVAEIISQETLKGKARRDDSRFKPDPRIPQDWTASNEDYKNAGYSRGHMSAAANHKNNQQNMDDTFYLTNIVPQNFDNNQVFWAKFEQFCRNLVWKQYPEIRVITGPLFLPNVFEEERNKRYVKYQVIGQNNVAVPTHLFKIIFAENPQDGKIHHASFVVPNAPIGPDKELIDFLIPTSVIEKNIGFKFMDDKLLKSNNILSLCDKIACSIRKHQRNPKDNGGSPKPTNDFNS